MQLPLHKAMTLHLLREQKIYWLLLEDYVHDSGASAVRAIDKARATATIHKDTHIKEVDTSAYGDDTEGDEDLDDTDSRENSASKQQTVPLPWLSQRVKKTYGV